MHDIQALEHMLDLVLLLRNLMVIEQELFNATLDQMQERALQCKH